jgi:hypothetical protein
VTLADFGLDDETVLFATPVPALPLSKAVRDAYYRDGQPGLDRLAALLFSDPVHEETRPPAEIEAPQASEVRGQPGRPAREVPYPSPDAPFEPLEFDYTETHIARLKGHLSYPGPYHLFELAAARSPEWVWKREVEDALGISAAQFRNELSAFTKLTNNLFGTKHWPCEVRRYGGLFFYRFNSTIAGWWTNAR